ncbi:MAG TPA: VOC family protein, partial [bacterium]|nr:VOC family protein [bacterium]
MTLSIHPQTTVGPVHLTVADLERSLRFYGEVLGLQVAGRHDGTVTLATTPDAPRAPAIVVLSALPGASPQPPRTTGLYHLAILMPSRTALARSLAHLIETRYRLQGASDHLVSEALYLADPEGNGIELYADRPRDQWPRRGDRIAMATDPLDLENLLAELGGAGDRREFALDPATRIGHMHLRVSDLATAEAFYVGLLGFDVTVRDYPGALFVSAGGYHHHIGMNTWGSAGAPPPAPDSAGLRDYTIRLPDQAALQPILERLRTAGVQMIQTPEGWRLADPS